MRGEIIAAAFNKEKLGRDALHQLLERVHVVADVFANSSVRTTAGLDGQDSILGQSFVPNQKLRVLAREDIVRDHAQRDLIAKLSAKSEKQRRLSTSNRSADTDGKRAGFIVAVQRGIALVK